MAKQRMQVWYLDDERFEQFMDMLEAPTTDMPKLRELLTTPTVFDQPKQ